MASCIGIELMQCFCWREHKSAEYLAGFCTLNWCKL